MGQASNSRHIVVLASGAPVFADTNIKAGWKFQQVWDQDSQQEYNGCQDTDRSNKEYSGGESRAAPSTWCLPMRTSPDQLSRTLQTHLHNLDASATRQGDFLPRPALPTRRGGGHASRRHRCRDKECRNLR